MPDRLPHWADALIGKPYRLGGRGPEAFDCWGLLQFVWRSRLGLIVPDIGAQVEGLAARVRAFRSVGYGQVMADEVAAPAEYDAVYMTGARWPHHIGMWVLPDARGGVLHAVEGAGVLFQRRTDLAAADYRIMRIMRVRRA